MITVVSVILSGHHFEKVKQIDNNKEILSLVACRRISSLGTKLRYTVGEEILRLRSG